LRQSRWVATLTLSLGLRPVISYLTTLGASTLL